MTSPMFRTAVVLGLLSAVGPFTIDMYLPALPMLAADLGIDEAASQATISAYFLAFGLVQLVYGPLADAFGRKRPVYVGASIFLVATIGCALAPTLPWLVAFRALQGVGCAALMVMPRAVVRDMYTGHEATRLVAMIMLVVSVSPMLAPLTGAVMMTFTGWRGIFWILAGVAAVALLLAVFALRETLPPERRRPVRPRQLALSARRLLRDPTFMALTFVAGFGMSSFFVFIASASFVYTEQYGLSPMQFSLAFATNAVGFFGASQFAAPLGRRIGLMRMLRLALTGFACTSLTLLAITAAGYASLPVLIGLLLAGNACLGLVIPTSQVMALDPHGEIAGLASSMGGTLQMLTGGLMVAATGPFFDGTALPMVAVIALCAVMALGLALLALGRGERSPQPV
ncbi:multidrug effflux MFS transporter [Limimaricola pyoseonensis]|uniref:Bcr/CflA family efflux transporter n=1 Tax=Limimaricola pyoseonensis TaxID=521013 RepID=A0A1G6ZRC0_9RHOB|nr:multidrug effflux MFS transporter [Limimaricola pyoseonensis]SDE05052.1 MFS transporter, DHA1 family, bicyclomycin/chloramphenicol resistance protein [Limimaricola pyoseonensis]